MKKSITLMELLVALAVATVIILYFFAIEKIARQDLFNIDRRNKVQNEVSYVLQHLSKNLPKTIGSRAVSGQDPIAVYTIPLIRDIVLIFFVDLADDCVSAGDGQWNTQCDHWRAYWYKPASTFPARYRYQLWYFGSCYGTNCTGAGTIGPEAIAKRITAFNCSITDNYVDVEVTGCWDPDGSPYACGTTSNPSVTMHAYINMPAVSTN
jgi:hypothetical protein